MMLNWADIQFPAINLWTAPRQNHQTNTDTMSNCREASDDDIEYLYACAEKIGKRPTEDQEEQFINRVFDLVRVDSISDSEARRVAFAEIIG